MKFGNLTKRKLEIIQKLKYKESKHPRKPGILYSSVRINIGNGNIIPCLIYIMPDTLEYAKNIDMTSIQCLRCYHSAKTCKCDYPHYSEPLAIMNSELRIEEREITNKNGKFIEVQVLMFAGNYENSFYEQWREDEPEKAKVADIEEERIRKENNYSDPWDSIGPDEGWSREGRPD